MEYLIFNVFIFPRFARFLFLSLISSIIDIYSEKLVESDNNKVFLKN